ncbi:hypothetical protein B9Z55_015784 [Caenorhabditis nigoni]|uniref:F-box domain-containing protein n=1 Tax=Caenorhabditis nigoni TaxID=1611254 RepID=A0A2G5UBQ7_9PELO|nr:hypothetical protein B9Z55_015784 [Caenorhabditis nigoni]
MPFPILRTPFVVLTEIISLLEPEEIVTASFCSKNVHRLLKGHYQQRELLGWRIYLNDCDSCGQVTIGLEGEINWKAVLSVLQISELDESKAKPIETNEYKRGFSLGSLDLYFEDRVMGTKWIVDYVTDLFNLNVYGLIIDTNGIWAIDWINNRQENMLECFKFDKNPKYYPNAEKDLDYVLRNARASDFIVIEDIFPVNYRFSGILGPVNHLLISPNGHWVTLDNLMNFDCIKIVINGSRISVTDVDSFLRHWRAGGSHRMTYLKVNFETHRNFENLEEQWEMIEADDLRVTTSFCSEKAKRLLKGHYQQRKPLEWNIYLKDCDSRGRVCIGKKDGRTRSPVLSAIHISELDESSEPEPIETNEYKRGFSSGLIDLYFEDRVMGTQWIVNYVTDLFSLNVYGLAIDRNSTWAIGWLNDRQEKMLESFELLKNPKCNSNSDEALNYVLRNARASDYIVLEDMVPVHFQFDGILGPVNHLLIKPNGHWLTLDNLMNFDFVKIKVRGSRISVTDLHSFLRHWRAGGSHRMAFLRLQFETDRNFERLEEELEIIEDRLRNGDEWNGDYSITRNDGVKAVIRFGTRYFIMNVLPPREII